MSRKRVLITLPVDAYRRLAEMADAEERVIDQQASMLLKRLLTDAVPRAEGAPGRDDSLSATAVTRRDGRLS